MPRNLRLMEYTCFGAKRLIPIACSLLPLAAAFLSCQSPYETPPAVERKVLVRTVDSSFTPLPSIPVEVYRAEGAGEKLFSTLTDRAGTALFLLRIPQNGGRFNFRVGTAQTGIVTIAADLLCRDTILTVMLGSLRIPCGAAIADTMRFVDVCARNPAGQEFPETIERQYCSACDVPLVVALPVTLPILQPPSDLRMRVFDADGAEVAGGSFTLPARGCFSVRITYTPKQTGTINGVIPIVGNAPGGESFNLALTVTGNAKDCNQCLCGDSLTILDLGSVVVGASPDSAAFLSTLVNRNKSSCERNDRLTKNFTPGSGFTLLGGVQGSVRPNESQPVQIRFLPERSGPARDTLVYVTVYPSSGLTCRHTVIVTGQGVQAACCLDLASTSAGYVQSSGSPRVDTLHLATRIDQTASGRICFRNCGTGGTATVSQSLAWPAAPGFDTAPASLQLRAGDPPQCFAVSFDATGSVVRPSGPGGPVKTRHETDLLIAGCDPRKVHIVVDVDTLPVQFSNCVYRWSQNSFNGYNFTPPENKGSFIFDANGDNQNMITDLTLMSIGAGSADVRIRSGWQLIRAGVVDQNDFAYATVRGWPKFSQIHTGAYNTAQAATLALFSVYAIRIERNGQISYALIRIREISTDGQKEKICFDVLYPL